MLLQKSRHDTLGNTDRWLGLSRAVLPLLGITRQQPGKRLAAHPWLLHKQLGKYNVMLCISSLKMPKSRQLAENNCINKAGVYLCGLGLVLHKQCSIIPFGNFCEQNRYLLPVKLSCYTHLVQLVNDFSDCNSF